MEEIEKIPKTALDVFRILPEGTLCEVIDNVLYMSPAPKYTHQRLLGMFYAKIFWHVDVAKIGEALISPLDVYFDDLLSAVQPDMIFITNENLDIIKDDGCIHGAPDLIIEVLSSDKKRDMVTKKILYERAGVKEYIIVNPVDRKIYAYLLEDGGYELTYEDEGFFRSRLLGFEFFF